MESLRLSCTGAGDFAETKCMICPQITPEKRITTQNGCKRIRAASDIRNDCVSKRMKLIPDESKFVYHVSNECYKTYTNANLLRRIQKREKMHETLLSSEITDSPLGVATQDGRMSHKREFAKYRISETNRATSLLRAANFFQDDIFGRICDLQDEHAVFGADLYYYRHCMTLYLQRFEQASHSTEESPELNSKQRAWAEIAPEIAVGLKGGTGYELSAIGDRLNRRVDVEHQFRNRDVKVFLLRHFGSNIDFTYPDDVCKCLMVYSVSCNRPDVLAEGIRPIDPIQVCASMLRQSLGSHDFDLDDRFGDAQDIKHACSSMTIPEPVLRFLGYLYNLNPLTYPKTAEAVMTETYLSTEVVNDETDDAHETVNCEGGNNSDCEQTTDGSLSTQRCRKIQALFQTMYYIHHCGRKRTPMHIMNAESAHSLGRGGKILTSILNHQGLALSYPELRRYQYDMATYTAHQNKHDVALPAHFDPGEFTSSAFDNWDHECCNVSEHDTVCVLFQDRPSSHRFKPKRSDILVEHGPQAFKETLPCQILQEFESHVKRPNIPSSFKGNDELYESDDTQTKKLTDIAWSIGRLNIDIKDNQVDRTVYPDQQSMPSWSASNTVWTDENVPLKHVAFLPVLPYPVTLYSAVYTQMSNLVAICAQLVQHKLPVYGDEKVYCMAKEIQFLRSAEFNGLVLCLGTFHTAKTLLKCNGKSLEGSGAEGV